MSSGALRVIAGNWFSASASSVSFRPSPTAMYGPPHTLTASAPPRATRSANEMWTPASSKSFCTFRSRLVAIFRPRFSGLFTSIRIEPLIPPVPVAGSKVPASWNTRRKTGGALPLSPPCNRDAISLLTRSTRSFSLVGRVEGISNCLGRKPLTPRAPAGDGTCTRREVSDVPASARRAPRRETRVALPSGPSVTGSVPPSSATAAVGHWREPVSRCDRGLPIGRVHGVATGLPRACLESKALLASRIMAVS
mmetsp:Transcript_5569/g.20287  ORF Transcript_5569/g.20287 Transcript_5569/m.20287 type:complete len:252 (+) Transcript_5569:449-1204(+)